MHRFAGMKFKLLFALIICFVMAACDQEPSYEQFNKIEVKPLYGFPDIHENRELINDLFVEWCDSNFMSLDIAYEYHMDAGWFYYRKGKHDSALLYFNRAWSIDAKNPDAYWAVGVIVGLQSHLDEAMMIFKIGHKLDENHAMIKLNLAEAYLTKFLRAKTNNTKTLFLDSADTFLSEMITLEPQNMDARYKWAYVKYFMGDYEGALAQVKWYQEITNKPFDSQFLTDLSQKMQIPND